MAKVRLVLGALAAFLGSALLGLVLLLAREARHASDSLHALETDLAELRAGVAAWPVPGRGRPNVLTGFNPDIDQPQLTPTTYVDPLASVIGDVSLGADVFVAPFASIRGDEGQPIAVGDEANVQDGVVIHALETLQHGQPVPNRTYEIDGRAYAVYIGRRVSLAHQSQVHGPARVDDGVFVGMQALVFKAWIGEGSVVEPGAKVIGVRVPPGRYVAAGTVVTDQAAADRLPVITESYPFRALNDAVVHVNTSFAQGYGSQAHPAPEDSVPPAQPRMAEAGAGGAGHH